MASFTDTIMQFNPYVAQLPVDAMVKVGMYKQQKYEEGVQKIQSYLDNVAGLDIMKVPVREYLQGRVNDLGGDLTKLAGADFSNFQIVSSVGGMVKQMVSDPIVQGGVSNTIKARKEIKNEEESKSTGKWSVDNSGYFQEEVLGKWLNDGSLTSPFAGKYTPYTDIEEKLRKLGKDVPKFDFSVDSPYIRDNDGKTILFDEKGKPTTDPKLGKPMYDDVLLRTKYKGQSAQKLLDNFYVSLDGNDMEQLKINAWAKYKNIPASEFKNSLIEDTNDAYELKKKFIQDELAETTAFLETNKSKLSAKERTDYEGRINRLTASLGENGIEKERKDYLKRLEGFTDEGLKTQIYSEKFLTDLANAMAYENISIQYQNNPGFKAMMDRKNLQFKYWNAQRDQNNKNREYDFKVKTFEWKKQQAILKNQPELKEFQDLGVETDEDGTIPSLNKLAEGIRNAGDNWENYMNKYGPVLMPKWNEKPPGMKDEDWVVQRRKTVIDMMNNYRTNPSAEKNPEKAKVLDELKTMDDEITSRMSEYLGVVNNPKVKAYDTEINKINNSPGLVKNGRTLFTVSELENIKNEIDNAKSFRDVDLPEGGTTRVEGATDYEKLKKKYKGTKYLPLITSHERSKSVFTWLSDDEEAMVDALDQVVYKSTKKRNDLQTGKNKEVANIIRTTSPEYNLLSTPLDVKNKVDDASLKAFLADRVALKGRVGAIPETTGTNYSGSLEKVNKWRSEKGSSGVIYNITKAGDNSKANLEVTKGGETVKLEMTGEELGKYFSQATATHPLDPIKFSILRSVNRTTNAMNYRGGGTEAAVNARFSGRSLPLLQGVPTASTVRWDVEGDMDNTGNPKTDGYLLRLYVPDNGIWKDGLVTERYVTLDGLQYVIENIGLQTVEQIKAQK